VRRARGPGLARLAAALFLALPAMACAQDAARPASAQEALRTGKYSQAIEMAQADVGRNAGDPAARRTLVQALMSVGRYPEAETAARAPGFSDLLGQTLRAQGKVEEAEAAFRRAIAQKEPGQLTAEENLGELLLSSGRRAEAFQRFDRFIDVYNSGGNLSAADLTAVGAAVEHLGARDPQLYRDALKAYDRAVAADQNALEARLRLGELFLDKYNSPDAQSTFEEVLAVNETEPRALLGMAQAKEFDGEAGDAFDLVRRALAVNPNLVPARVMLARLYLDYEDSDLAEAELQKALKVNPSSLEALSVLAAIRFVQGDEAAYRELRDRVIRLDAGNAAFYTSVGEIAARYRRYAEAAGLGQEAIAIDTLSAPSYGLLGLNQLRLGKVDDAKRSLERAFKGDPYNVWIKNTLDLLDTYPQYETRKTPRFDLVLHKDEADLLYPYMAPLAEEAYDKVTTRYGYKPATPVRVEVYPRNADFSVRTVGLAGLGALGVSFGNVLAMDSPHARDIGDLNWGSTMWHEFTHAVTLGLSNHRVPRWLTEGISVREERRARPGWGSEINPEFLSAYFEGELPPVSKLNEGFVRPRSPGHLGLAYHMASMVVEWVEETQGFDAITRMLKAYGDGQSTPQVLRTGLRMEPEAVDRAFDAWLRKKYTPATLTDLSTEEGEAAHMMEIGNVAEAQRHLERAVEILPGYADSGRSPLAKLTMLYLQKRDTVGAARTLTKLTLLNENAYGENVQLSQLLEHTGDRAGAAAALERAIYIYPYELPLHTRLAELYAGLGDKQKVVRERRALVALKPVDEAEARYALALSLMDAGDRAGARSEVLRALEVAPGFEKAQELLLRTREGAP
jgi:tetratricopeptide (TPR) repeat protein